jgi:hypothetical protein
VSGAPFVTGLRTPAEPLVVPAPPATPTWTLRVQAAEAWDAVKVVCAPDAPVAAVKAAAMAALYPTDQVPAEVVDGIERHTPGRGVGLGCGHTDHQRAGQSGSNGGGDDVGAVDAGGCQSPAHGGAQRLQVCAGSDLGHHATEPRVLLDAGSDLIGEQRDSPVSINAGDADSCFVTGAFDGQDGAGAHGGSRRMVKASAPLAR